MVDTSTSTITRSPYEILQINCWADDEEIKAQYFHLVKQYNPEYFPDEFIEIRTAYELLKDSANRASIDVENFIPPPAYHHSDYAEFPEQPLSLFKLNQELKTLCGDRQPEQLEGEEREKLFHILRGIALYQAYHGNLEDAQAKWDWILRQDEEQRECRTNLIYTYWQQGYTAAINQQYEEAEKLFDSISGEDCHPGVLFQNLALSREKQGKKAEADVAWQSCLKAYQQKLKANPENEYLRAVLVSLHKYTGGKFLEGGGAALSSGDGATKGSVKELGYACLRQGNWKQAVEALEQALRENEDDIDVLCQLGWAYLNTNQHNRAFHMWNLALKKSPGRKQVTDHLIRGYTIFGKRLKEQRIFNQALVQFKNALKYDSNNIDLRHQLADTYFQMRNFSAAVQEFQRILDIEPRNKEAKQGIREAKRLGGLR